MNKFWIKYVNFYVINHETMKSLKSNREYVYWVIVKSTSCRFFYIHFYITIDVIGFRSFSRPVAVSHVGHGTRPPTMVGPHVMYRVNCFDAHNPSNIRAFMQHGA